MRQVFAEVWRVMTPTATLWVNCGDAYTSGNRVGHGTRVGYKQQTNRGMNGTHDPQRAPQPPGLREKNLLGLPWRLALALQADGWILRSAITWCKAAPMPESVQDRPTRATEMLFLFAKQPHYYYDATAVRVTSGNGWHGSTFTSDYMVATKPGLGQQTRQEAPGRNLWDYWVLGPEPLNMGHYAAFPTELVRRCLLAGAPQQVCSACGAPCVRQVERTFHGQYNQQEGAAQRLRCAGVISGGTERVTLGRTEYIRTSTTGFSPTCTCAAPTRKAVVLDPFCGSGTTLLVARELGHHGIGLDLSREYLTHIARERLGLAALAAWAGSGQARPSLAYADLPLFQHAEVT
jgi:hypothetical protein